MTLKQQRYGFIGLGLMGLPMSRNLLNAGATLTVTSRTAAKAESLIAEGAQYAPTAVDLARAVRGGTIIICVDNTASLKSVIAGPGGLLEGPLDKSLIIDMGTSDVETTKALAARIQAAGGAYIDAPVSGGAVGAEVGELSIMAGGSAEDIKRTSPAFEVLGKAYTHIGPVSTGQVAKAANQVIVGATVTIVAEALLLAREAGADPAKTREALLGGFASSRVLELHGQRMIDRQFEPGARATTQLKDLKQALRLCEQLGLSLPSMHAVHALWEAMVESGGGELDQSGYFEFVGNKNQKT